ncbi:unnamed protein product [Cyberlindnera jadinii]|uniref:rRNA biogenesis protein RRP36 n=1 Tax=Cyberlindnera jadinii (strain ATCC 18201 / CBS 1600 / BCRC 20928 / JCM 3617 / NBRC 0987 / NRRL Y-1542) TaxID=983966 RepID=A0A0H5CGZ9_CYBJN|nr:unnamed protein product [Cyberlindnera jadinii]
MAKKHLAPQFSDDEDDVSGYLEMSEQSSDDELETLSFGALKSAQAELEKEEKQKKNKKKAKSKEQNSKRESVHMSRDARRQPTKSSNREYDSESDEFENDGFSDMSDGMFDEEEDDDDSSNVGNNNKKKKSKHAPTETSSKRKVSKIRQIPGLENRKNETSLYRDIRFDAAFGKADLNRVRKDYKFLDDYRQQEVSEITKILKDPKMRNKLSQREIEDLEYQSKSLRSRLDTLKNRDLEQEVVKKYKEERGIKGNFFLKKSDKRKIVQKHKFDNMKASQREKVVERKRKRRLGKEFKQLEFNRPRD